MDVSGREWHKVLHVYGLSDTLVGVEYSKCRSRGAFEGGIRGRRDTYGGTNGAKCRTRRIAGQPGYASTQTTRDSFAADKSSGGVHINLTLATIGWRGWNRMYRLQVGDAGK